MTCEQCDERIESLTTPYDLAGPEHEVTLCSLECLIEWAANRLTERRQNQTKAE
jgi:hypothetical protein